MSEGVPLQIAFGIQEVDESTLLPILAAEYPDVLQTGETFVVPVFGQGRMLPPFPAEGMQEEWIWEITGYLCGACSCQVKRDNPGMDLLISADWEALVGEGRVLTEKTLPPLEGAALLAAPTPPPHASGAAEASATNAGNPVSRTLTLAIAGSVILVAGSTAVYFAKHPRS